MENKKLLATTLQLGIPLEGKWAQIFSPEDNKTKESIPKQPDTTEKTKKQKSEKDRSKIIQAEVKRLEEETRAEMIKKEEYQRMLIQTEIKKLEEESKSKVESFEKASGEQKEIDNKENNKNLFPPHSSGWL